MPQKQDSVQTGATIKDIKLDISAIDAQFAAECQAARFFSPH